MNTLPDHMTRQATSDIGQMIGRELLNVDTDKQTIDMAFNIDSRFLNMQGVIHGGIIATMLDTLCGAVIYANTDPTQFAGQMTLEMKTSFFKAGQPGAYQGKGRVLRLGKSIAFAESELYDSEGDCVGRASATFKRRANKIHNKHQK